MGRDENTSYRVTDVSLLSQEQMDTELEKGYTDIQVGNVLDAEQTFNSIRQG